MSTGRISIVAGAAALVALVFGAVPAVGTVTGDIGVARASVDLTGAPDTSTTLDTSDEGFTFPDQSEGIGPGAHLLIEMPLPEGGEGTFGCTASWVYASGSDLLLGAAGHCFLPEGEIATSGHGGVYDASQTTVKVCVSGCTNGGFSGFDITGTLVELGDVVYARQADESGQHQIGYDFGLVEIPAALHDLVRPTMPLFGGPYGEGRLESGDQVCHYGNGIVVGEVYPTMGRTGVGIFADHDAWFAASPAAPGDSGAAVQTCITDSAGITAVGAIGTLTHLSSLGVAGTTNDRATEMAAADAGLAIELVLSDG